MLIIYILTIENILVQSFTLCVGKIALLAIDWPQSLMSIFFSKTDNLSKIEIYKLYLEVEVLGLDISKFDYQRG